MRKNILIWFLCLLVLPLAACGAAESEPPQTAESAEIAQTVSEDSTEEELIEKPTRIPEQTPQKITEPEVPEVSEGKKIRFLVDGQEIVVALEDHPAADALYARLPMELAFEDFNGTEKIAYPEEALPTEGAPDQCDPNVGSFCYYIPWGNFCFFYQDFRASESLMPLGEVESGLALLESLDTAGTVTVEAVE